ncbi:MAG: hypothetical protein GXP44_00910, partial [bacterium]|nr:hypothetical protein [bacterium]
RGTELARKDPVSFAKALALKELGDEIAYVVAGRNVHPTRTTAGGFHKIPTKEALMKLLSKLEETAKAAEWTAEFFAGLEYPELKVDIELVAMEGDKIVSGKTGAEPIKNYKENIEEELRDNSTAKFGKYQGREMMVGSLARMAILKEKKDSAVEKYAAKLDFENPFHNNLAQAIEILQYHQMARESVKKLLDAEMDPEIGVMEPDFAPDADGLFKGIGAVEAPRGGLYHEIHLDKKGIIVYANIITPTVQNLTSMEKSAQAVLDQYKEKSQEEKERLMNMVIRAYDPCITCSVH